MTNEQKPVYPEPQHFPEVVYDPTPAAVTNPAYAHPANPMPHVEHTYSKQNFVCVRCGSNNIARGYVVDYGDKFQTVHFAPKRIPLRWLNSLFNLRPWRRLLPLNAEACRDCGAVLLVVDPEELRHAERQRE